MSSVASTTRSNMMKRVAAPPTTLLFALKSLVNNKLYSDVQIKIDGEIFHAHKCMLALRCVVFRDLFRSTKPETGSEPTVIELERPQPAIFAQILEYIYTGTMTFSEGTIVQILGTAIDYQLTDLTQLCLTYLYEIVNVDNACEFLQAARTFKQADLERNMFEFVEKNATKVLKSKGFVELEESTLIAVLKSDNLVCKENDVLLATKEWGTVNSVINGETLSDSLKSVIVHVRLPMLAAEELKIAEEENEKMDYVPVSMLAAAWRYHALKTSDLGPQTTPRAGYV